VIDGGAAPGVRPKSRPTPPSQGDLF
jgi:hypothetical protein